MENHAINRDPDSGFLATLEGMRALAVGAVLLYHLWPSVFPGGYLGVDLFFVISGFIITRNLVRSARGDSYSLAIFYRRRFHRLAPALVTVVAASLLAGLCWLPPAELAALGQSSVYALLGLANVGFWLDAGYFDTLAQIKPLLHTWSLGVEEQFYLLWPALVLICYRRGRLLDLVVVVLVSSVLLSLLQQSARPDAVFYLLPFRAHQLAAGALLAVTAWQLSGHSGTIAALVGLSGFSACVLLVGGDTPPGTSALAASAVSLALLSARHHPLCRGTLGMRWLQWLGRRSYAIYLMHWPLIVYAGFALDFEVGNGMLVALGVASIVLGAFLYRFIERPLRLSDVVAPRVGATVTIAAAGLTALFASAHIWGDGGYPLRASPAVAELLSSVPRETMLRRNSIRFGSCMLHSSHSVADFDRAQCSAAVPEMTNVMIMGDSTAADVYLMLSLQPNSRLNLQQATATGCPPLLQLRGGEHPTCRLFNELRFGELLESGVDHVVLAANWRDTDLEALLATVDFLKRREIAVTVAGPRVKFSESIILFLSRQDSLVGVNQRAAGLVQRPGKLAQLMTRKLPGVKVLDLEAVQCSPDCSVLGLTGLLYVDNIHLSWQGARLFGRRLLPQLQSAIRD